MIEKQKKRITNRVLAHLVSWRDLRLGIILQDLPRLGCTPGQLRRILQELIDEGIVVRDGERGQATYRLVKP